MQLVLQANDSSERKTVEEGPYKCLLSVWPCFLELFLFCMQSKHTVVGLSLGTVQFLHDGQVLIKHSIDPHQNVDGSLQRVYCYSLFLPVSTLTVIKLEIFIDNTGICMVVF